MDRIYTHGGYIDGRIEEYLDFSANIAPFGMPGKVKEAVRASIEKAERYPDPFCTKLREALAEKYGVGAENIIPGNGACDLIYRIAGAFAAMPRFSKTAERKQALIVEPAFSEYERALCFNETETLHYFTKSSDISGLTEGLESSHSQNSAVGLVFLANPANPTGTLIRREALTRLAKACERKGTVLVVDECFMGFLKDDSDYSMLPAIRKDPGAFRNVLVLNAFTKLYAMPGLRLGYLIGSNPDLLKKIDALRQPWNISVPAYEAGLAALKLSEEEYRIPLVQYITKQRAFLKKELSGLGFRVADGQANYLFFESDRMDLKERLLEKGILIRDCSDYYGLSKGCYRVAVRREEENVRLIEALR